MATTDSNVVRFPSGTSRRAHSQKPRRSKNGKERHAKAAIEFLQRMRTLLLEEFARGKDVDQIFDDLEKGCLANMARDRQETV
jgi:hypothetical protein